MHEFHKQLLSFLVSAGTIVTLNTAVVKVSGLQWGKISLSVGACLIEEKIFCLQNLAKYFPHLISFKRNSFFKTRCNILNISERQLYNLSLICFNKCQRQSTATGGMLSQAYPQSWTGVTYPDRHRLRLLLWHKHPYPLQAGSAMQASLPENNVCLKPWDYMTQTSAKTK